MRMSDAPALLSAASRNAAGMVAVFLSSSPHSEPGGSGGEGLTPALRVTATACSLGGSVWIFWETSSLGQLVWCGNRLLRGPAGPGREVGTALLPQEVTRWPPWAWCLSHAWDLGDSSHPQHSHGEKALRPSHGCQP